MKTKSNNRARVMRGQTHRQQWAIVYEDGARKRWRERACGSAMDMILGFIGFVGSNKRKDWNTPSGMLPVRLLAPGGIIAAEHNVKPRHNKPAKAQIKFPPKTAKRELIDTAKLRTSITAPEPAGYPFLTMRNPHARKSTGK